MGEPGGPETLRPYSSFKALTSLCVGGFRSTEMREKSLAAFLVSLSFSIMSSRNGSEGASRPPPPGPHKRLMSVGLGRLEKPIRLTWDAAKFSYGFHIIGLVLTPVSFLATIPL